MAVRWMRSDERITVKRPKSVRMQPRRMHVRETIVIFMHDMQGSSKAASARASERAKCREDCGCMWKIQRYRSSIRAGIWEVGRADWIMARRISESGHVLLIFMSLCRLQGWECFACVVDQLLRRVRVLCVLLRFSWEEPLQPADSPAPPLWRGHRQGMRDDGMECAFWDSRLSWLAGCFGMARMGAVGGCAICVTIDLSCRAKNYGW